MNYCPEIITQALSQADLGYKVLDKQSCPIPIWFTNIEGLRSKRIEMLQDTLVKSGWL